MTAPLHVRGDPLALEQMFLNLLLNSAHALSAGGHAQVSAVLDDTTLRVVITDTGVGIATSDLPRVLDPFYSTTTDGTGARISDCPADRDRARRFTRNREHGWRRDECRGPASAGGGALRLINRSLRNGVIPSGAPKARSRGIERYG